MHVRQHGDRLQGVAEELQLTLLPEKHRRGREAEDAAVERLRANGFEILWRNLRIGALELDVVARKGDLVVVVEVRARGVGSFQTALASISPAKRRTLLRATRALWQRHVAAMADVKRLRIDVAGVTVHPDASVDVEWIAGAISEDEA